MYMAQLVKNAYELKVQINSEVNERLTKMAEDLDKKSRWIKRDLLEEIEKIKIAMETSNAQKFAEMTEPFGKRLETMEEILRRDRTEWTKAVQEDRDAMLKLEAKLGTLRRDMKQQGDGTSTLDAAAASLAAAKAANGAEPAAAKGDAPPPGTASPAPPAATAAKQGIPDNTTMSGFLPDLGKKG